MSRKWYHNKEPSSPKLKKKSQELSSSCRGWGIMLWWRVSWWMELTWTGWSWEKENNTPSIKETQYQCYRWTLKWSCTCCSVAPSHSETAMQRLWSRRSWQDSTRRCLEWGGEAISKNAKDLITQLFVVDPSGKGGSVQNISKYLLWRGKKVFTVLGSEGYNDLKKVLISNISLTVSGALTHRLPQHTFKIQNGSRGLQRVITIVHWVLWITFAK